MASVKKIVKSFLKRPAQAEYRFSDVIKVLEYFGFEEDNRFGSHFIYVRRELRITVSHHGEKVKYGYIRNIIAILELEEWFENQKRS